MKRFILIITILFSLTISGFAKQFCVRIDCYKIDDTNWRRPEVHINIEDEINKYLNKGYKLIAITPKTIVCGYGCKTVCFYCIFEDGKKEENK